jgi:hypothetical protein
MYNNIGTEESREKLLEKLASVRREMVSEYHDLHLKDISEDAYTPQQIFDQVWEAPYEWFMLPDVPENSSDNLPSVVWEINYPNLFKHEKVAEFTITEEMIERATFRFFYEYIIKNDPSRKLSDFVEDLDGNDVDAILQLACFGEIRYG